MTNEELMENSFRFVNSQVDYVTAPAGTITYTWKDAGVQKSKTVSNLSKLNQGLMPQLSHRYVPTHEVTSWEEIKEIVLDSPVGGIVKFKFLNDIKLTSTARFGVNIEFNFNGFKLESGSDENGDVFYIGTTTLSNIFIMLNMSVAGSKLITPPINLSNSSYNTLVRSWVGKLHLIIYSGTVELSGTNLLSAHSAGWISVLLQGVTIKKGVSYTNGKLYMNNTFIPSVKRHSCVLEDTLLWSDILGGVNYVD